MSEDKRLSEVIRVVKRPNHYTMLDTGFLNNCNLSWKAKGILAYLLSKPDNWKAITGDIVNHATDGKGSVYKALGELKEQGYYNKIPVRDEKGVIVRWDSVVQESPNVTNVDITASYPLPKNQEMDNQEMGNPFMDNPPLTIFNNKNINNSYMESSQVMSDRTDEQSIQQYTDFIKSGIRYDDFLVSRPHDITLIDEFIYIILDTILTANKTVKINGENKPRALVKGCLLKLTYSDTEYAIEQFKSVTGRINNKRQYILTILYNAKMEQNSHYTNLVKSDLSQGGDSNA